MAEFIRCNDGEVTLNNAQTVYRCTINNGGEFLTEAEVQAIYGTPTQSITVEQAHQIGWALGLVLFVAYKGKKYIEMLRFS